MNKLPLFNFKIKELLIIVSFLATSFIVVFPLLRYGLPPTHDGEYHVLRAYQFDKTLRDGDLYPRWLPDLNFGYGTPLLNYYYPLPYYMTSFAHFLGFSFIDAFKLCMLVATLLSALFFFLWARIFWGKSGAFVACLFYTFAPYHIVEIYVRGTSGEVWALSFFPAFLWSTTILVKERKSVFLPLSAVFFSLIIFSHNILALLFFPFAVAYILLLFYLYVDKRRYIQTMSSLLSMIFLGVGLAAIFWLPALAETGLVRGLQIYDIKEGFVDLYELLVPSWGTGFSGTGLNGQMSFQIGIANLLAVFLSSVSFALFYKKKDKRFWVVGFFLLWFAFVFFLMQEVSLPIWEKVPFMNYFQFPWRFLGLEILIAAFLSGSIFSFLKGKKSLVCLVGFSLFVVLLSIGYINPAYYLEREDNYYFTRSNFIDGTNTPGNLFNTIWFSKSIAKRSKEKFEIKEGRGKITEKSIKSTEYRFLLSAKNSVVILVHTAYFPNWQAFVDGKKVKTKSDNLGLIEFSVPRGNHEIFVKFQNTPIRIVSEVISFFSFCTILILFPVNRHGRMKK